MRMYSIIIVLVALLAIKTANAAEQAGVIYLSDRPDLILFSQQGWGELGLDVAAHMPDTEPLPFTINDKTYTKGLGTHAPGEIIIDLNGQYSAFDAEIGVLKQPYNDGSVVFKVYVDGKETYNSGKMLQNTPAKKIHIPVINADELKLLVTDAGDGIACDAANWAEARLTINPTAYAEKEKTRIDIAQFGRICTWDPARTDGARNARTQEFKPEDLFLEIPLKKTSDGTYSLQKYQNNKACIGVQWIERRRIEQTAIQFTEDSYIPPVNETQVQYWAPANQGASPANTSWQGKWQPLKGEIRKDGSRLVFNSDWAGNKDARTGTLKIRWIFPSADNIKVQNLTAFSKSGWASMDLLIQAENSGRKKHGTIDIYNGEIISGYKGKWDLSKPIKIRIRYCKPSSWSSEKTVLRVKLPDSSFGVGISDILEKGCVYVKGSGFFAANLSSGINLADYKDRIKDSKTVLEMVREMPDQTFEQAIKHVHRPEADHGPTMLSLPCNNQKFVLSRDGSISFDPTHNHSGEANYPANLFAEYGSGENKKLTRQLDEDWMPIPIINVDKDGVTYTQRTFVASLDKEPVSQNSAISTSTMPVCVSEFTIKNNKPEAADVSLALWFSPDAKNAEQSLTKPWGSGAMFIHNDKIRILVGNVDTTTLIPRIKDGKWTLSGKLPANSGAKVTAYIPGWDAKPSELPSMQNADDLLADTKALWQGIMDSAMQFEIPDKMLTNIIKASQVHCMIAARNDSGTMIAPWIASTFYGPLESEANSIIRGMQFTGHEDFARQSFDFFIKRYNKEGYLTTGYTMMGTGWHLWTLGEYYGLSRDKQWLQANAPEIARLCKWIMAQREKTKKLDADGNKAPEYGLMPPGVMADWEAYSYYFYLNGYYCAGLRSAGEALADINYPDATAILKDAEDFKKEIMRAFHWVQSLAPVYPLRNGTWVPEYPTHVYSPMPVNDLCKGEDYGRSWCYDVELGAHHLVPMGIMEPGSSDAKRIMDHMEDVQFLSDGWFYYPAEDSRKDWFNLGGFAKVQPYYARTTEVYAMRDDVKPFIRSYFNAVVSLLNREDLSLWEHFVNGAYNKTHETGYFIYQSRLMLLAERGNQLWLAPFVTNNWMEDGMSVSVENAPSLFGKVGYKITSNASAGHIDAVIDPISGNGLKEIVIRLRHPEGKLIQKVTVNGKEYRNFDPKREIVTLQPSAEKINITAWY